MGTDLLPPPPNLIWVSEAFKKNYKTVDVKRLDAENPFGPPIPLPTKVWTGWHKKFYYDE